jgi:hypothetical protein
MRALGAVGVLAGWRATVHAPRRLTHVSTVAAIRANNGSRDHPLSEFV